MGFRYDFQMAGSLLRATAHGASIFTGQGEKAVRHLAVTNQRPRSVHDQVDVNLSPKVPTGTRDIDLGTLLVHDDDFWEFRAIVRHPVQPADVFRTRLLFIRRFSAVRFDLSACLGRAGFRFDRIERFEQIVFVGLD